jgi:hypothetical protein
LAAGSGSDGADSVAAGAADACGDGFGTEAAAGVDAAADADAGADVGAVGAGGSGASGTDSTVAPVDGGEAAAEA